jgi:uncharacterized protein YuzE
MATMTRKNKTTLRSVSGALALAKIVSDLPTTKLYLDYDADADVLYISLKRPQRATHTEELPEQGILLDYREKDLVGITVLDASTRS